MVLFLNFSASKISDCWPPKYQKLPIVRRQREIPPRDLHPVSTFFYKTTAGVFHHPVDINISRKACLCTVGFSKGRTSVSFVQLWRVNLFFSIP